MKPCNNCKHWTAHSKHDDNLGDCSHPKWVEVSFGDAPIDGVAYWDYEGYSAGFYTGPEFGCIHHKTR